MSIGKISLSVKSVQTKCKLSDRVITVYICNNDVCGAAGVGAGASFQPSSLLDGPWPRPARPDAESHREPGEDLVPKSTLQEQAAHSAEIRRDSCYDVMLCRRQGRPEVVRWRHLIGSNVSGRACDSRVWVMVVLDSCGQRCCKLYNQFTSEWRSLSDDASDSPAVQPRTLCSSRQCR